MTVTDELFKDNEAYSAVFDQGHLPFIENKDQIRGFVFDVETGSLKEIPF